MGTELATTKNAPVHDFGEPDIVRVEGGELVMNLRGIDVYDATSGEVRSDTTDKIAVEVIDDYGDEVTPTVPWGRARR